MAYMIAWFLILSASGQGPAAVGVTTQQVRTAEHNFINHGVLPTVENTNQPPIPRRASITEGARIRGGKFVQR